MRASTVRNLIACGAIAVAASVLSGGGAPATRPAASRPTGIATTRAASVEPAPNPHWSSTGCSACHEGEDRRAAPDAVNGMCLRCHDGRRARQEIHPVGVTFTVGDQMRRPERWPVVGGRLGCATCHDIHGACLAGGRPRENPAFLRGAWRTPAAFCASCHVGTSGQARYNPHRMLKSDGTIDTRACLFCHTGDAAKWMTEGRRGQSALKGEPIGLCLGCHTRHLDWFEPGHTGRVVPDRMRVYMVAFEATPEGAPVDAARLAEALRKRQGPTWLPLGAGDRVVCSTCHNPHEKGVFPTDSVLGRGGMTPAVRSQPPGAKQLPLRGLGKEVCRACHDK